MSDGRIVIIGAGQAGLQAAMSLRQEGYAGDITMIGAEPGLPYQRPPLSKVYLKTGDAEALTLRPQAFFEKKAISLVSDTWIERIDRSSQRVFAGDRQWEYDHLVLATGTRNLRPPIPGVAAAHDLRTREDAEQLRAVLGKPLRIAVIGGGFIGLEFAAVATTLGHQVTVAERTSRLMSRAVSPAMSQLFLEMHLDMGTEILLGAPVSAVAADGIMLSDGRNVPADLILLAVGVQPNTELAAAAGLTIDNGIAVDASLLTSDPAISAIGDCASFPTPGTERRVRLESVQAATDHARALARRIVKGDTTPYGAVAWFWSDQSDWKLQIAGLAAPSDESVVGDGTTVFRFRGDEMTAVETINDAKTHMRARKRLARHPAPSRADLEAVEYNVASFDERQVT